MADKQLKKDFQALSQLFKYIPDDTEVLLTTQYKLSLKGYWSKRTLKAKRPLSITQYEQYVKLKALNDEILKRQDAYLKLELNEFIDSLTPKYALGDKCLEVDGIEAIETEGFTTTPATWKPKDGIVTLVEFYVQLQNNYKQYWDSGGQQFMQQNQEMLSRNQYWKGKVEFVGFTIDHQIVDMAQWIKSTQLTQVNLYRFINSVNFVHKAFDIHYLMPPFVALLNKQGKIIYKGDPAEGNLEETINTLIAEEEQNDTQIQQKEVEQQLQEEEYILLEKAEFKALRAKVNSEILEFLKQLDFQKSNLKLVLTKTNRVSKAGKVPKQRTQIIVNYSIPIEQKAKLDEFLNFLNNSLAGKFTIGVGVLEDPKGQQNEFKLVIEQECKKNGVEIRYQDIRIHKFYYQGTDETLNYKLKSETQTVVKQCSVEQVQSIVAAMKPIINNLPDDDIDDFARSIMKKIKKASNKKVGDTFVQIEGYKKSGLQVESLTHTPGQILVVVYWAQQYDDCLLALPENNEILKANKAVNGNSVRLVALSVGEKGTDQEYLQQNPNLDETEFYFPTQEAQQDIKQYGVNEHPFYIIVDKEGIIKHLGSEINLKEFIDNLIASKAQQAEKEIVTLGQISKVRQLLEQSMEVLKSMGNKHQFKFNLSFHALYQSDAADAELVKVKKPTLKYTVRSDKVEQLNKVLSEIFNIIPKEHFKKVVERITKVFDIPFPGKECIVCKGELTDQIPQYYSPFKNEFVCVACAEFDDKAQIGQARFKYSDTLIFINAPLIDLSVLQGIEKKRKGKNLQVPLGEAGDQNHTTICSSCSKSSVGARYISLNARSGQHRMGGFTEYCDDCFAILKNKNSEEAQKIIQYDAKDGMCTDGLFLRVLFNHGDEDY